MFLMISFKICVFELFSKLISKIYKNKAQIILYVLLETYKFANIYIYYMCVFQYT